MLSRDALPATIAVRRIRAGERGGSLVDTVIAERFEIVLNKGRILLEEKAFDYSVGYKQVEMVPREPLAAWRSQGLTLLRTVFGPDHGYATEFDKGTADPAVLFPIASFVSVGLGVLTAAAEDHTNGYTWTLRERVHADVFDDYLEMAVALLKDGYVTAAAVIAGTTLEEHLRKLCQKHGVAISKRASVMNDALLKQSVYSQAEWRLNQGWLDIRNDCAHNLATTYDKAQIQQMIDGVRGFIARNAA